MTAARPLPSAGGFQAVDTLNTRWMSLAVASWTLLLTLSGPTIRLIAAEPATGRSLREYRDAAFRQDGDAERGRSLFLSEQRTACIRCHTLDGKGGKAGPDLSAIGDKFPRAELVRSVLEPSAAIAVGYGTTVVETRSGELHTGILKQATAESVELITGDGQTVRLATSEIARQEGSKLSLMPEGLQAGLTREEFADLIQFLTTLRQPESALGIHRGMPSEIPSLTKGVTLRPLFTDPLRYPAGSAVPPGSVTSGLVWMGELPGHPGTFLVAHQSGHIWRFEKASSETPSTLFLDLSKELFNERGPNGLLGLAFHPKFSSNRKYYLKHQVFEQGKIATTVVEREMSMDGMSDSGKPSRRILKIESTTQDHSGGCIEFGPDGYLYVGMGDTGPQQDPQGHGQDFGTLLGKLSRIDVDRREGELAYAIPQDNPFRNRTGARPEIWANGFREPWRFSFDPVTGDLWVGDVGQDRVEEVSVVRRGENHGWNVFEGFEPFSNRYRKEGTEYVSPVFAYRRKFGNSITGGRVYRGKAQASFQGVYICGDFSSRRIWGLKQTGRRLDSIYELGKSPEGIASFTVDSNGELYLVGYEGHVYHLDLTGSEYPSTQEVAPSRSAQALPAR